MEEEMIFFPKKNNNILNSLCESLHMANSFFACSFLLLFFPAISFAADLPPSIPSGDYVLLFYARDFSTSQPLAGNVLQFWMSSSNRTIISSEASGEDGFVVLFIDGGTWNVKSEIEDTQTQGRDHVAITSLSISRDTNYTLNFQPVGTIYIEAKDEGGQPIPRASASIDCVNSAYNVQELNDDLTVQNGVLLVKYVPTGACRITVSNDYGSTSNDVNLARGELKNISMQLKQQNNFLQSALVILAALAVLLALFFLLKRKAITQKTKKEEITTQKTTVRAHKRKISSKTPGSNSDSQFMQSTLNKTKRMIDLMNTLNERERTIVETLLKHDGKLKQSKLYRETLIPKTSLARAVQSLQTRNIIELIPFGKTNYVKLSKWFLKGEEE